MQLPVRTSSARARPPFTRSAGILLHVTSLPSRYGIGDLGPAAYRWVDQLARAKQSWWQVLPLGPPARGTRRTRRFPRLRETRARQSRAAHGRGAAQSRRLGPSYPRPIPRRPGGLPAGGDVQGRVDYKRVAALRGRHGRQAARGAFEAFTSRHKAWLDDFTLFMALKEARAARSWTDWPKPLVLRDRAALADAKTGSGGGDRPTPVRPIPVLPTTRRHCDEYARQKGVRLIGDLPIFVSPESSDVWAKPHLFQLDRQRRPTAVAGVPPDFFSRDGPAVGQPAVRLAGHAPRRFRLVGRPDAGDARAGGPRAPGPFPRVRGLLEDPRPPADRRPGPVGEGAGDGVVRRPAKGLGKLPLIAEDLGVITPDVERLRDEFGLPGHARPAVRLRRRPRQSTCRTSTSATWPPTPARTTTRRPPAGTGGSTGNTATSYTATRRSKDRPGMGPHPTGVVIRRKAGDRADAGRPAAGQRGADEHAGDRVGNWGWRMAEGMLRNETLDRLAELTETYGRVNTVKRRGTQCDTGFQPVLAMSVLRKPRFSKSRRRSHGLEARVTAVDHRASAHFAGFVGAAPPCRGRTRGIRPRPRPAGP